MTLNCEYGRYLASLGKKNKDIIALEADLKESTQSVQFQRLFPERYLEVGIAEQNMVGIAAGLALSGKIPIVHSFACFISMRSCEQVRTTVAYPRLNVKFVVTHAGVSTGSAGTTHHSIEDVAIMRAIPNMTVIVPCDANEMKQALDEAIKYKGPVYIRLSSIEASDVYRKEDKFSLGKSTQLNEGDDAAIITTGTLASEGLHAARMLKERYGLKVRVLQMACIKPLDTAAVSKAARETGLIVTCEEHNRLGGLGSAVSEVIADLGRGRVNRLGIDDSFCECGSYAHLLKQNGLHAENIASLINNLVKEENKYKKCLK